MARRRGTKRLGFSRRRPSRAQRMTALRRDVRRFNRARQRAINRRRRR